MAYFLEQLFDSWPCLRYTGAGQRCKPCAHGSASFSREEVMPADLLTKALELAASIASLVASVVQVIAAWGWRHNDEDRRR